MRTRFLEALAVGCPVILTAGGTVSRLVADHDAGWVVPPGDAAALADALRSAIGDETECRRRTDNGRVVATRFAAERSYRPIVTFARQPWRDETKEAFAFRPDTRAPADAPGFRLRRRLRILLGGDPPG